MNKSGKILALLGLMVLLLSASAWAQPAAPGAGPGGPGPGLGIQYDPQKLETISGEVTQVQASPRRSKGVHLEVKTDKETLFVILGPATYLEKEKLTLAVGDKVQVTGSRIKHPQRAIILAGEIKKGDQVVKLRDDKGLPLWRLGPKRQ